MRASCALTAFSRASCNGDLSGPLAIMICKPRQARKGATVAVNYVPGCGWLGRHLSYPLLLLCLSFVISPFLSPRFSCLCSTLQFLLLFILSNLHFPDAPTKY